jgi:hypothetical protein
MSIRRALDALLEALQDAGIPLVASMARGLLRAEIDARVASLPGQLPAEVVEYFEWRNGLTPDREADVELFPQGIPLSLDEAVAQYDAQRHFAAQIANQSAPCRPGADRCTRTRPASDTRDSRMGARRAQGRNSARRADPRARRSAGNGQAERRRRADAAGSETALSRSYRCAVRRRLDVRGVEARCHGGERLRRSLPAQFVDRVE